MSAISGQSTTSFQVIGGVVAQNLNALISAAAGNSTVQATVAVNGGNPPALSVPAQVGGQTTTAIQFTVSAQDAYSLPVTLLASGLPAGATFDGKTGAFLWTPTTTQMGTFAVTISAADTAGLSSFKTAVINVTSNQATILGLYNAASLTMDQTCSPGSLATLVGYNFTSANPPFPNQAPWPTQLGGVQVMVNGSATPLLAVTSEQVNFQCPNLTPGTVLTITLETTNTVSPPPIQATMVETTPALFAINASGQGAVLIAGTNILAMPPTDGIPSRPAQVGEYLAIYANGLGPVTQPVTPGTPAPTDHTISTIDQVTVYLGGVAYTPSFAGLAPGVAGLYQVNVALNSGVVTGNSVPLYVTVTRADGTMATSNTVTVAIQSAGQ
ncbi:MAG TPA: putative Ig domain-containing protein [Bryobacteraceae bacterium]|nr:putative Ig domain-containing protein [Bryobacteraceae bacterium]